MDSRKHPDEAESGRSLSPRHRGAARGRDRRRPPLPRRGAVPGGRLRRGRRLLRHLRLPDHQTAAGRARPQRDDLPARLLRAPRQTPAAALGGPAGDGRRALDDPALAAAQHRSRRGHRQLRPLRRQLALRRPVGRLLRPGPRTEPGPPPLVAGDRGAVLPRLAGADAGRDLVLAPPRALGPAGALGRPDADPRGLARLRHRPDRRQTGLRLLLDLRPRLGARRSAPPSR